MNNNIQEDYVSFEEAKLLKEKGFDSNCEFYIGEENILMNDYGERNRNSEFPKDSQYCSAPTCALTIKWIRENFEIDLHAEWSFSENGKRFYVYKIDGKESEKCYKSSEEAESAAILYTLQNLIK